MNENRYISFHPTNEGQATAIRVTLAELDGFDGYIGEARWVGPPDMYPDEGMDPPTLVAAPLQCDPYFADWSAALSGRLLHVYGAEVVPGSAYDIDVVHDSCSDALADDTAYSDPLRVVTSKWGDVVEPFFVQGGSAQPDFTDIAALVEKFTGSATAPTKAQAQLQPNVPDPTKAIDFSDIAAVVAAFMGEPYPFEGPSACP